MKYIEEKKETKFSMIFTDYLLLFELDKTNIFWPHACLNLV